jgi:O-antigen/teichoic acid export membrane protein
MSIESRALTQKVGSALKWNYFGVVARSLSSLTIGIILARLLGPKPFGLVAIAMLMIGFCNLLADFGIGAAIVQRESLSEEDIRFAFFSQLFVGVFLALACFLGAGVAAQLFRSQEVAPVIRVLSLTFPLQALGQTASNLLKRKLAFRAVQTAQIASSFVYFTIGISLAATGLGVWALVIAQLVQVSVNSVMAYSMAPHSLRFSFQVNRSLIAYGVKVLGSSFANWLVSNLDNAFVGRAFGVVALGLYSRAFQLAYTPILAVVSGLQGVLLSAYARAQRQTDALRRVYLSSMAVMAVVTVPLFVAAATVPSTIILALYGRSWAGAAPLFVPLALATPLFALLSLAGPLLWATGEVGRDLKVQCASAFAAVVVFAVTSHFSVVCLAWGVLAVYAFRFLGLTREMAQHLKIRWTEIGLALRGSAALALLAAASVWFFDGLMLRIGLPAMVRLVSDIAAALSITVVPLVLAPTAVLGPNADYILVHTRPMVPEGIQRFMPHTNDGNPKPSCARNSLMPVPVVTPDSSTNGVPVIAPDTHSCLNRRI